jgi:hypothetical protein
VARRRAYSSRYLVRITGACSRMSTLRIVVFLALGLGIAVTSGCTREAEPKPTGPPPPTFDPVPPPKAPIAPSAIGPRPKREVLVGGCMDRCATPKLALENFLTASLSGDVDAVRPFVNTAILTHGGVRHGDRWAQLFMERQPAERRTDIDKWLKNWVAWTDRISDPADRQASSLARLSAVESNQRRHVVDYARPSLEPDFGARELAPTWRLTLKPRGLEWLVAEIDDRPRP